MIIYSDTSALFKRYLDEEGSAIVRDCLDEALFRYTSAFTQLELISAIEWAKRTRRTNSPSYRSMIAQLSADIRCGLFTQIDVSHPILAQSIPLIRVRKLKPPDALQLATAIEVNKRVRGELHFLCADHALLEAARSEGLRCKDASR